jgi:2-polyprenyl-6-methoxyphenol hydroxylase-like FAD-dependent oxidoreductase
MNIARPMFRNVVIVGSSMAGLLAARVLLDHCEQVTIVERDQFPATPQSRRGLPQDRHLHVLLMRGLSVLEKLIPTFVDDLAQAGAIVLDPANDFLWVNFAGSGVRFQSGYRLLACSRALIDWHLRKHVFAFPRLRVLEGTVATGLLPTDKERGIGGVRIRQREADAARGSETELAADLVVDASGRGSKLPQWLEALGYPRPVETIVDPHLGYASRIYMPPADADIGWLGVFAPASPPRHPRGCVIFPIEGGRWMVTAGGGDTEYPPVDESGFMAFLRSLATPLIYEAVEKAEALSPVYAFRGTENRLRHYEALGKVWPCGLATLGDAVCAFNPVYGQGMTMAVLGAELLGRCLDEYNARQLSGTEALRLFQVRLAKLNAGPWWLATSEDSRYRMTQGTVKTGRWKKRLFDLYIDRLVVCATQSIEVRRTILEVRHMLRPSTALVHPRMLVAALHAGSVP